MNKTKQNMVNDWENIISYWEEPQQSKALANKYVGHFKSSFAVLHAGSSGTPSMESFQHLNCLKIVT